jgi:elongator complex protein 2
VGSETVAAGPPLEERLMQDTLWAERARLYGHGYELSAVACSPDGRTLASASHSTSLAHAAVRLWDPATLQETAVCAPAHKLSVTQMAFSHDSQRLLAVSRDRAWSLWRRGDSRAALSLSVSLCLSGLTWAGQRSSTAW